MPTHDFIVRPAREKDAPAAAALAGELVRFHHALDPDRFAILADPLEPGYARFLASLTKRADAVVLVAEYRAATKRRSIVGYAFGIVEDVSWPDLLAKHGRFHDLFVHPAHRGRGIGKALAEYMIEELCRRGAPRVVLSAAWANPGARRMFKSLGFRPTMLEMTRECSVPAVPQRTKPHRQQRATPRRQRTNQRPRGSTK